MVVRSETPDPVGADQSLGDLVALATKDASQLLRYEIDLAKTELKSDVKRVGIAAGLSVMAAFGTVHSPWGICALPAGVLTGMAFGVPMAAFSATRDKDTAFITLYQHSTRSGRRVPVRRWSG